MSLKELATIVFGLFAGYWVVAKLFFPAKPKAVPAPTPPPPPALPEPAWHEVLEVPPDADVDTFHRAYQRLMSQYHPDKVASLGQELQDLAERKSQRINAAYQQGLAARGVAR